MTTSQVVYAGSNDSNRRLLGRKEVEIHHLGLSDNNSTEILLRDGELGIDMTLLLPDCRLLAQVS